MRTYGYYLYTRQMMDDRMRVGGPAPSPYGFERRQDDQREPLPVTLVLGAAVTYVVVLLAIVAAVVMTTGGPVDAGTTASAGRQAASCHGSIPDRWSGCVPGAIRRVA